MSKRNKKIVIITIRRRRSGTTREEALRKARTENPGWSVVSAQKHTPDFVSYRIMMKRKK